MFITAPRSICILRLSAIGDCCHAIAMVQAIQRQWPETHITWIAGKLEAKLLTLLPNIEIITFDKKDGWQGYLKLWKQLEDRKFDSLLHMQAALRASIVSIGIKAKYRLGFEHERAKDGQWLFTNVKSQSEGFHALDGFMGFAKTLGIQDLTPKWDFPLAQTLLDEAAAFKDERPLLLICPAASKAYKNWTAEGYAALADHAKKKGFKIILIGSPAPIEIELAQKIETLTPSVDTNLVGETTLAQLMALIKNADLVVAPDTGPAHMATVMGTAVMGLYAHHNPKRTGPYNCLDYVVSVYDEALLAETGKTPEQVSWRTRVKDEKAMQRIKSGDVIKMFDLICSDKNLLATIK